MQVRSDAHLCLTEQKLIFSFSGVGMSNAAKNDRDALAASLQGVPARDMRPSESPRHLQILTVVCY